jgi:CheY-like chemotaxis protein
MLDRLDGYLRATLGASRAPAHPLADEFDRLRDYLELMGAHGPAAGVHARAARGAARSARAPLLLQPLVENAIRHGLEPRVEGGRIEVAARREAGELVLTVRDTGAGFDPQAPPRRPLRPGAGGRARGLGHRRPGAPGRAVAARRRHHRAHHASHRLTRHAHRPDRRRRTLLAAAAGRAARAWPELQVVATVGDGASAVREALRLKPDVLLLDIRMPGLSGLDAAAELADAWDSRAKPFPALAFVTAYDQYALQAFEAQALDYVLKPVQPERLQKSVQKLQLVLAGRAQRYQSSSNRRCRAAGHRRAAAPPAGRAATRRRAAALQQLPVSPPARAAA